LLAGLALLGLAATLSAVAPEPEPTSEQKKRLGEATFLQSQAVSLVLAGKANEAVVQFKKALAIEREVLGNDHTAVLESLGALATLLGEARDFSQAAGVWAEVHKQRLRRAGPDNWRVVEAQREETYAREMLERSADDQHRLDKANTLHRQAMTLHGQRRFAESASVAQEAMTIRADILGATHPYTLRSLINLAEASVDAHDSNAFALASRAALHTREVFGEQHPDCAGGLGVLGRAYVLRGELASAREYLEKALAIRASCLGPRDRTVIVARSNLSGVYRHMNDHRRLIAQLECARELIRTTPSRSSGPHSVEYAVALTSLSEAYQGLGDHLTGVKFSEEANELVHDLVGDRHPLYAYTLINLARAHGVRGEYLKSVKLFEQARDLLLRSSSLVAGAGEMNPTYAACILNLAGAYQTVGEMDRARETFEKAVAAFRKIRGEDHPEYAQALGRMGEFHLALGEWDAAGKKFEQVRDVIARSLGKTHAAYALCIENLGHLHKAQGDVAGARKLYEQALDIRTAEQGDLHSERIQAMDSLGRFLLEQGQFDAARLVLGRVSTARKAALGEDHPDYALSLGRLAIAYHRSGKPKRAETLANQAISLLEKSSEPRPVEMATVLNNQALFYLDTHQCDRGLAVMKRALAIEKEIHGEPSPHLNNALGNLALLHKATGNMAEAESLYHEILSWDCRQLELTREVMPDHQHHLHRERLRTTLGFYLTCAEQAHTPAARQYDVVLNCKAALTGYPLVRCGQPEATEILTRLREVRVELAALNALAPTPAGSADWRKHHAELMKEKTTLEDRLARVSEEQRWCQRQQQANSSTLPAALPKGTALVEVIAYDHWGTRVPKDGEDHPKADSKMEWQREERLVVFVVTHDKPVVRVPLGSVRAIDHAATAWRKTLQTGSEPVDERAAHTLRRLVWQPIHKHLHGAKTVLVAGDGVLRDLPLAALPGERPGSFLIEEVAIAHLSHGREALHEKPGEERALGKGLLALGGLEYGKHTVTTAEPEAAAADFASLSGSLSEAKQVESLFRRHFPKDRTRLLKGEEADRAALVWQLSPMVRAPQWRYLHLATHASYTPLIESLIGTGSTAPRLFDRAYRHALTERTPPVNVKLALSGANRAEEQGLFSLDDVRWVNLHGCELVVLSATAAKGTKVDAEGLANLSRAFRHAGARSVLVSQWKRNDPAACVLLEQFYGNLWERKMTRLEALRQAQLYVLKNPDKVKERAREMRGPILRTRAEVPADEEPTRSHPGWWAGFVLLGEGW
jgi:CHAT domain-containing protein/tetratricopeptide (TPR) repeat protein